MKLASPPTDELDAGTPAHVEGLGLSASGSAGVGAITTAGIAPREMADRHAREMQHRCLTRSLVRLRCTRA